jgi:hypothetical protein
MMTTNVIILLEFTNGGADDSHATMTTAAP